MKVRVVLVPTLAAHNLKLRVLYEYSNPFSEQGWLFPVFPRHEKCVHHFMEDVLRTAKV